MGIVVSTIHASVKFHTPCGIGTVFSTYKPNKIEKGQKKVKENILEVMKNVLSCVDTEERIIVNGIPRTIMVGGNPFNTKHKLNEYKHIERVKQKKHGLAPKQNEAACKEMPFGLENAGATYERLVEKVFNDQIRQNLEAYVDDMVIKSVSEEDMLIDIKETFDRIRSINMKLNPKKCSFGVEEGPFCNTPIFGLRSGDYNGCY
ncbi:reverse transcriptase domain-containing protein [Tanacetum coccineum]